MASGTGDILRGLVDPVAGRVARAVGEFGDDAVRSVMKLNPEMRKRLAALAEKRIVSSAAPKFRASSGGPIEQQENEIVKTLTKYFTKGVDDVNVRIPSILAAPESRMEMLPVAHVIDDLTRLAPNKRRGIAQLSNLGDDEISALSRRDDFKKEALRRLDVERRFFNDYPDAAEGVTIADALAALPESRMADVAAQEYQDAVLGIASGKIPQGMTAEINIAKRAKVLDDALYADISRRAKEYAKKYGRLPNSNNIAITRLERTNLPALTSQLDLVSLLRAIGDSQ